MQPRGTKETREFYDTLGWTQNSDGQTLEHKLFGVTEDGPIRKELHAARHRRIIDALRSADPPLTLLECGCGGHPTLSLLELCREYTGVDFSETGISVAEKQFNGVKLPYKFKVADVCALPFSTASFDAVYSAHMIYHIFEPSSQAAAMSEMVRVTRPGGIIVIIAANPRPILFPVQFAKRLLAGWPIARRVGSVIKKSPLPYNPRPIPWMVKHLSEHCDVEVFTGGLATNRFNRSVSENQYPGKGLWHLIKRVEMSAPRFAARLGNYLIFICRKRA